MPPKPHSQNCHTHTRQADALAIWPGTMRDNVLGLTAVMADGRIIRTGRRVRKSSSGFDLTALLVGSEGTLGVITEVALRLRPRPEAIAAAVVEFGSMQVSLQEKLNCCHQCIRGAICIASPLSLQLGHLNHTLKSVRALHCCCHRHQRRLILGLPGIYECTASAAGTACS